MDIDLLEPVRLGESTQWIRIRAANARNPLLLLVQQGPGLPMLSEVRTFERVLSLEDDFTVIYWDQRGCGRSLRSADATRDLSIETMVGDTERLLAMLCDRFDTPAVVAGFSMGAMIAARAAARPAGPGGDARRGEHGHRRRRRRKERLRVRARRRAGQAEPPGRSAAHDDRATHPTSRLRGSRREARWAANFGGVRIGQTYNSMARDLLASLLRSPDYSLADAVRAIRGITATTAAVLPELEALDLTATLPRLDCPVVMVQGRHDQVAPGSAAERYAEVLTAPSKQFVWFEHSAHMPQLDEPGRFREVLAKVRLGLPANS